MIIDSETVFDNVSEHPTDNDIIEIALTALYQSDMGEGYLFEKQQGRFDKITVSRVVSTMETNNLVTKYQGAYDDIYTSNYKIERQGRFIAGNGGWISYLENLKSESDWIDEVLRDAKKDSVVLIRATPDQYQDAVLRLVDEGLLTPKTYRLTPKGRDALKAGSYEKWQEWEAAEKRQAANKSNSITIHGPVIGSWVNQDSSLRELSITQSDQAAPIANEKEQKAKSSSVLNIILGIIATVIGGVILLYIEHKTGFFTGK